MADNPLEEDVRLVTTDRMIERALSTYTTTLDGVTMIARRCSELRIKDADDKAGFDLVHAARMEVRDLRVGVEKKRKELNADALKYKNAVDGHARKLREALTAVETPLQSQETEYKAERERRRKAKEEERMAMVEERLCRLAAFEVHALPSQVEHLESEEFETWIGEAHAAHELILEEREEEAKRAAVIEGERKRREAALAETQRKLEEERRKRAEQDAEIERLRRKEREAQEAERRKEEIAKARRAGVEAERERAAKDAMLVRVSPAGLEARPVPRYMFFVLAKGPKGVGPFTDQEAASRWVHEHHEGDSPPPFEVLSLIPPSAPWPPKEQA